jgi:hypothetical protein
MLMKINRYGLLEGHPEFSITEIDIHSNYIDCIRYSVFKILLILSEGNYLEIAKQLRRNIFYYLKVPHHDWGGMFLNTPFDQNITKIFDVYGEEINAAVCHINRNLEHVLVNGSPMVVALKSKLPQFETEGPIVFYVESKFKQEFQSIIENINDGQIISSITEYKKIDIFHTLVFVGSLRCDSYTSLPNYFLRNVKFKNLVQFKWAGQKNDYLFFATPVSRLKLIFLESESIRAEASHEQVKKQEFILNNDNINEGEIDHENVDEFEIYKKLSLDSFPALCLKLIEQKAILYPPNAKLIVVVEEANKFSVQYTKAIEIQAINNENIYLASFELPENSLSPLNESDSAYQAVWKNVLLNQDLDSMIGALKRANIRLKNLESCLGDWCEFSENIIKAPQEKANFIILLECIKAELITYSETSTADFESWCEGAWREILSSRGIAISGGLQHSIDFEERLYSAIKKFVKSHSATTLPLSNKKFQVRVGQHKSDVSLHKVSAIEFGYDAPKKLLKKVISQGESKLYR